jgi:hypothetical protein
MVVKPLAMSTDALTRMLTHELVFDIILIEELDRTILVFGNLNTRWGLAFLIHLNILV